MDLEKKVTPLMRQYYKVKDKYPDALLLFRVGDFYETFHDDAVKASSILGIILTKRGAGSNSETKLAGFPHHSLNTYLHKLVKAGERVAICEQLEDPKKTKSIVRRGVTELITPGVALNDGILEQKSNNFLASVFNIKNQYGISFLDISTGELLIAEGNLEYVKNLLSNYDAKEILVCKKNKSDFINEFGNYSSVFYFDDWVFNKDFALEKIKNHFDVSGLKGFGISENNLGLLACGSILHYLDETQHKKLEHITKINQIIDSSHVWMDQFTVANLELIYSNSKEGKSLIDIIDYTSSPMGARMLKRWLIHPLLDLKKLNFRHSSVDEIIKNKDLLFSLQEELRSLSDLERIIAKVVTFKISPRELVQLKESLNKVKSIKDLLSEKSLINLYKINSSLDCCESIIKLLEQTLNNEAPVNIKKGNVIKENFNSELDELRSLSISGKDYLNKILEREKNNTGITSLKISFNNVFGYFIEVRNIHKDKVPEDWIRKQTLVNAERYITSELKDYEAKILGAEEKISVLESKLFEELIIKLIKDVEVIQNNSFWLANLDCFVGFANLALKAKYNKPTLNNSKDLEITKGRHPVIESQLSQDSPYVPNDLKLCDKTNQILMITGPNMSGKSAILRQTALIVLLAQIGSFVPAEKAKIGIIDKIFTRVGASDNISAGESTFMVEMNESASIINNISKNSLVLLDEIGRGTSTYDGISIAWAIAEFLHDHPYKPKTLFATHYHELNMMADSFERVNNVNVSVKETKNSVLFLRKLVPGGSAHSFGIHVAQMAGMPKGLILSAKKMLKKLEKSHNVGNDISRNNESEMQLSFFNLDNPKLEELKEDLISLNIDELTPIEALIKLNEIKRILKS
ncbi:DNA mismatch repair protein MutS [Flavobacteriaceae bacterium]|nr:DNA mismatch repair protein MutS [Flavobacteriaceae bacterium]MDB4601125.1 DNA mismatch repair protein MutS [Flavobacteriaceae bacterium]MDC0472147.1 DNA mismatch repair protein MutS [Flavobacteriaceae bacterium]MDC0506767.1 DNA mismatch repair protein MutS [Flavobacteriaceae bacterium]